MICEKTAKMNRKLDGETCFKASDKWLIQFKSDNGIRQLTITGEKLGANSTECIEEF